MPTITVEGPALGDIEKKRTLAKRLTDAAVDAYNIKQIVVLIKENAAENVAVDGELVCDRRKHGGS